MLGSTTLFSNMNVMQAATVYTIHRIKQYVTVNTGCCVTFSVMDCLLYAGAMSAKILLYDI